MSAGKGWLRSPVVGGIVGVFAGGITVLLLEAAGHQVFGTADPLTEAVTVPMYLSVLVAWVVGAASAGAVATYWARSTGVLVGGIAGLVLFAGTVANFFAFPHPLWLIVSAVLLMPGAGFFGASMAKDASA